MKAVLLDTGVIVACLDRSEEFHEQCVAADGGIALETQQVIRDSDSVIHTGLPDRRQEIKRQTGSFRSRRPEDIERGQ